MPGTRACAAVGCFEVYRGRFSKAKLHRFPGEFDRCFRWVKACGNWRLLNTPISKLQHKYFLCRKHFARDQMMCNRLMNTAVPTIFDIGPLTDEQMIVWVKINSVFTEGPDTSTIIRNIVKNPKIRIKLPNAVLTLSEMLNGEGEAESEPKSTGDNDNEISVADNTSLTSVAEQQPKSTDLNENEPSVAANTSFSNFESHSVSARSSSEKRLTEPSLLEHISRNQACDNQIFTRVPEQQPKFINFNENGISVAAKTSVTNFESSSVSARSSCEKYLTEPSLLEHISRNQACDSYKIFTRVAEQQPKFTNFNENGISAGAKTSFTNFESHSVSARSSHEKRLTEPSLLEHVSRNRASDSYQIFTHVPEVKPESPDSFENETLVADHTYVTSEAALEPKSTDANRKGTSDAHKPSLTNFDGDSFSYRVTVGAVGDENGAKSSFYKMCRLCACLISEEKLIGLFSEEAIKQNLVKKIKRLLPEQIQMDDRLPHLVCSICVSNLNTCSAILETFIEADQKLRGIFENSDTALQKPADAKTTQVVSSTDTNETLRRDSSADNEWPVAVNTNDEDTHSDNEEEIAVCPNSMIKENPLFNKVLIPTGTQYSFKRNTAVVHRNKYRKLYMCRKCGKSYDNEKALRLHMRQGHITAKKTCEFCGAYYSNELQLEAHRRSHTGEEPFVCDVCKEVFECKSDLISHRRKTHAEPLTCRYCPKTYTSRAGVRFHEETHLPNSAALCDLCGRTLANPRAFKDHMMHHSRQRSCPKCGKIFRNRQRLERHLAAPSCSNTFRCGVCNRRFRSEEVLRQHEILHTKLRPYSCEMCGAAFKVLDSLKAHQKKHNQEEKVMPYHECKICGKWLRSILTFKYHVAKHTGEKQPYDCEICGKKYSCVSALRDHLRIHTGEKPFECSICNKKFHTNCNLKHHLAVHTDEKPYLCNFCGLRFKRRQTLADHKQRHANEKPFACPICCRRFYLKGEMTRHTKSQHKMMVLEVQDLVDSESNIAANFLSDMPILEKEIECSDIPEDISSVRDENVTC